MAPPIEFCAAYYVAQFRASLHFSLLPLLVDLLKFYKIVLSQLVSNAVRVVVTFEAHCQSFEIPSFVGLFRSLFIIKVSVVPG